jgi:hypothetical protein
MIPMVAPTAVIISIMAKARLELYEKRQLD